MGWGSLQNEYPRARRRSARHGNVSPQNEHPRVRRRSSERQRPGYDSRVADPRAAARSTGEGERPGGASRVVDPRAAVRRSGRRVGGGGGRIEAERVRQEFGTPELTRGGASWRTGWG